MEGSKLKVSDTLSCLYSEEKHKISDIIPLNFLLHFTDYQFHNFRVQPFGGKALCAQTS